MKVALTNCDGVAFALREEGADLIQALADETPERRVRKITWADEQDEELSCMNLELNQADEDSHADDHKVAWDDVKNIQLDIEKVRHARNLEMGFICARKVYKYATKAEAKRLGHKIIGVKWVDTNKGDEESENYRSRLVAQEFRNKGGTGFFAATPP